MTNFLIEVARYVGAIGTLALLPACLYISHKGEDIRLALVARSERRVVDRRNRLTRRLIEGGRVSRRAERALHNDYDYECVHWWGDRNPGATDTSNREFGGASTSLNSRRCTVCRPYGDDEEDVFLGYSETAPALAWSDSYEAYARDRRYERDEVPR